MRGPGYADTFTTYVMLWTASRAVSKCDQGVFGFGIGIAHEFAALGTIGFEGRYDYYNRKGVERCLSFLR